MTVLETILFLASVVAPAFLADEVPLGTAGPYSSLHPGAGTPIHRQLSGNTPDRQATHRLMAVSNSPQGAATFAAALIDVVDGQRHDDGLLSVEYVSDPLEDHDDPSQWRWTSTLEIRHHTTRRS